MLQLVRGLPLREEQRRLAAILAADVAGYSRLMAADESGTLGQLRRLRAEVFEPKIAQFHGRIVGSAGDSLLIEFASAVNAVQCAVEAQRDLDGQNASLPESRRMAFRMGVNLGDVIVEDNTIHGDGVNIAARLEKLAEPGGVCIGRTIYDQVKGKLAYAYDDLGEQRVHNMAEPVRAYRVRPPKASADSLPGSPVRDALPLPDRPSIAVLPFQNMSGDVEQEYFADGMVEEIITALSRMRSLFVIARNSSFAYKGRSVDVKQVGRELGVRYLLEGSVRKSGNRVRITGQLIDAGTGAHLWAERFDGGLEDIFDLQDQVTASVVGAIAPKLEQAEIERARRKPTENLDAYDYFLRGMAAFHQWSNEANNEALRLFYKAIELDPNFAAAYAMAARSYSQRKSGGWMTDRAYEIAETARLAHRAGEIGRDDASALCSAGAALGFVAGDLDGAAAHIEKALVLNPNLAWAWLSSALVKVWLGETEVAIEHATHAMRLSPQDAQVFVMQFAIGLAHFFAGRYSEALTWAEMARRAQPVHAPSNALAAASGALVGNRAAADGAMAHLRQLMPELRMTNLKDFVPIRRSEHFDRWAGAIRQAGLPE
jgi:TolB-like protein/class 3 adenylate cyclase